ncbi:MAG: hypothetical protein KGO96_07110 [Elusimicrobia bacterium]|nr:hypothetical protein [Elusimicrobiota bacterium]
MTFKSNLYKFFLRVLEENETRCMDDENDREILAKSLIESFENMLEYWVKEEDDDF